ncbi:MAG: hypothetical protein IID42_06580 [Planctomycetes bacterium]|nr:hypothetical protein [Planctomycetota bacterium]
MEHPELARLCFLGNAYAMAERMDDARKQLAKMYKLKGDLPGHHMWFGEMHAALGEEDEAFRRLDQALAAREAWLPHIRFDPGLIHIRSDPRFAELHRKMGLGHVDLSYASKSVSTASDHAKKTMLAVLPFANLSGDPEQEYFSDGMTEERITRLGRSRPELLGVIARTSAMRYKNTVKAIEEIGRELNVAYVVEGSVRRSGTGTDDARGDVVVLRRTLFDSSSRLTGLSANSDKPMSR